MTLAATITATFTTSRHRYGAPRVHHKQRAAGHHVGRKRVACLMRAAGLPSLDTQIDTLVRACAPGLLARRGGECQGSCRMSRHAAVRPCVSRSSFVGFNRTVVTGVQLRVAPRQRAGCVARASA